MNFFYFQMEIEKEFQHCPLVHINNTAVVHMSQYEFLISDGEQETPSVLSTGTYKQ